MFVSYFPMSRKTETTYANGLGDVETRISQQIGKYLAVVQQRKFSQKHVHTKSYIYIYIYIYTHTKTTATILRI